MKNINWKKYFDAIYCLSLADNLKRREFLSDELNRVGILNSGIFHWKITVVNNFYKYIWTNKDFNLNKYWGNVTGNNSALNCSMGHYELYRELQALGYKRVLILEDDICFLNNLDEICEILEFMPDDYDICLLDKFLCEPLARKEYFNEINKMKVNTCFFNYDNIPLSSCGLFAVSEKAINALVEKHENSIEPPDHYTNRITFRNGKPLIYEDGLKRYCSIKNVAIQNANLNPPSKHKHLQIAYQGIINLEEYNYRLGDESNVTEPKNNKKKDNPELKVALCCIGRLENKYIREYVSYYEKIGFDKIFLYDNNMKDEERFEDVIGDYIENDFVEVIDYRGRDRAQLSAYQDCYDRHGDEYDWIGFFDIDEFFTFINRKPNIKEYLSDERLNGYDMIHVNWLCYGDNDLVRYEDKPVTKRFTHPITPFDSKRTYDFPENNHIKTLIRGGLNNVKWSKTPHTPICDGIKCCNGAGEECNPNSPFNNYEYSTVCLRHYQTKTIEEFYTNKVKRGYPDGNKSFFDTHSWATNFFKSNKSTPEKLAYINEVSDNENKLDIFICTHKDFEPPVKNPCYKIINAKDINNDTAENGLPGSFYSEFLIYFDVAKRKDLKDYIGFCHYRKYFSFMDNIPDMDDLFKECDIVTVDRITFRKNIKEQYAACHNVDDLEIVENIIREKFPEYADAADYTFNRCNKMFQCNMFIMKKNDFLDYIKFIKSVLDEYLNVVGMDINQRILDNKEKYLKNIKDKPQNSEIWYQYRIGGYLGERLTNVFIYGNRERFGKIKTYKLTETEEKYKKKDKEMKKLALIIPTKDNSESLLRLLYSIVYHTKYNKAKLALYIVDNGSKENEKNKIIEHINRVIKEYGYNIKFYETDNYTLPQLYNFVANEKVDADTDLLLFCTDNVELTNDCISNLVNNWSEQCGTLGARLMLEDNTIQHIGYNIKKDNFTCYDVVQKQVLPVEYRNTKINVYGNSNSFMLTSFALWKQLNGFDEKYKSNFFDIDYSIKALLNGKNSYNITGAVCWYHKTIKSKYAKRDENRISKRIKEYLTILDEAAEKRREDKAKNA